MPGSVDSIPLLSVAPIAANIAEADITEKDLREIGQELVKAFTDTGFCYIKDHGVDQSLLDKSVELSKAFFGLPIEAKKSCLRGDGGEDYFGWLPIPHTDGIDRKPEYFDESLPPDYKETYNVSSHIDESRFPKEVPDFRPTVMQMSEIMNLLSNRVLLALGYALNLDDPKALTKTALKAGTSDSDTMTRFAYYPHIPPECRKEGLLRCGEHTDFGLITFVLDNGEPGLQIKKRDGNYMMVPRREGAMAVNIADALERLTGGILWSAPHRVVITEGERYSVIYFKVPDCDALLDPLCGAKEKYQEKITTKEFFARRFADIFYRGVGVAKNTSD